MSDNPTKAKFERWLATYESEEEGATTLGDLEAAFAAGYASHWMEAKVKEWDGPSLIAEDNRDNEQS